MEIIPGQNELKEVKSANIKTMRDFTMKNNKEIE
jgi:hypothetical protein